MRILDENCLSSGDTSHLSVARFKLDLAIQPQGVDPVGYESPLRASLQGDEQNELARLRSKRKVRQALHSETIALVSWRYQLPQNGIRRQA
jgi:hypothetical protein